jgi:hypothetical protein
VRRGGFAADEQLRIAPGYGGQFVPPHAGLVLLRRAMRIRATQQPEATAITTATNSTAH